MGIPAERLPKPPRKKVNKAALGRRQGLTEPLRITQGITQGQMAATLRQAARDAEDMVRLGLGPGVGGIVRADQLRAATRGLTELSNRLWTRMQEQIATGVTDVSELVATQQLLRELDMGMPRELLVQYSDNLFFSATQSANDILSRHTNGFTLSQRVYRNSQATVLHVGQIVDSGLARQLSAREIARLVRRYIDPITPGGASYAAMRLGRTEINNAHHDTTIRLSQDRPWVTGYQWKLSGSHPKPDICNEYASENDGLFDKGEVPSKPHPQCLCYILVSQVPEREFLRNLASGNYDGYLSSQGARR